MSVGDVLRIEHAHGSHAAACLLGNRAAVTVLTPGGGGGSASGGAPQDAVMAVAQQVQLCFSLVTARRFFDFVAPNERSLETYVARSLAPTTHVSHRIAVA